MKYTIKVHWRRLQGRCLRCGSTKERAGMERWMFRCGSNRRHQWKMR